MRRFCKLFEGANDSIENTNENLELVLTKKKKIKNLRKYDQPHENLINENSDHSENYFTHTMIKN